MENTNLFAALPSLTSLATSLGSPKTLLTAKKFAFVALPETSIVQSTLEVSVLTPLIPLPVCSRTFLYIILIVKNQNRIQNGGGLLPQHPVIIVLEPQEK